MLVRRDILTGLAFVAAALLLPFPAFAEPGVMADKIVLGQAAIFEGPASALGLGMHPIARDAGVPFTGMDDLREPHLPHVVNVRGAVLEIRKAQPEAVVMVGGFKVSFGPNDNRGSDDVYLTVIGADGQFKSVSTLIA